MRELLVYFPYALALLALLPYSEASLDSRLQKALRKLDDISRGEVNAVISLISKLQRVAMSIVLNFAYTDLAIIGVVLSLKKGQIMADDFLSVFAVILVAHILLIVLWLRNRADSASMTIYDLEVPYFGRIKGKLYLWLFALSVVLLPALARRAIELILL